MADILKRAKPLAVNPLKVSQPVGASLAFLGLKNAIPMLHGSQGCTAFGKVFFVRHFREPIPFQTTAMDQISTVMGADENVVEGLRTLCEKSRPEIIGLPTTGLSETQGTDIKRLVGQFRTRHPEYAHVAVVPVNTPDYVGSLETGFALAVEAIIDALVQKSAHGSISDHQSKIGRRHKQVNVLASSMHTPGDIEALKDWIEAFGLRPVVLPDLGDSLDGHLVPQETTPLTLGGTPRAEIESMGESVATLVVGRSLARAADLLKERGAFAAYIAEHPTAGDVVPESGGIRKVRWGRAGSGKSSGVRMIYFTRNSEGEVVLLTLYAKAKTDNLTGPKLNPDCPLDRAKTV